MTDMRTAINGDSELAEWVRIIFPAGASCSPLIPDCVPAVLFLTDKLLAYGFDPPALCDVPRSAVEASPRLSTPEMLQAVLTAARSHSDADLRKSLASVHKIPYF